MRSGNSLDIKGIRSDEAPTGNTPATEIDQRGTIAFAGNDLEAMALFEHLSVPQGEQSRDTNHEYAHGAGDAVLGQAAPLGVNLQIDEGAEHVDPVAQTEDGRDVEGGQADSYDVNHCGENAGHSEGKGDPAKCSAEAHAMNFGRFFEGGFMARNIWAVKMNASEARLETLNETHADESRDIDGTAFKSEEVSEPSVQDTDSRMGDQRPAHGGVNSEV